MEEIEAKPHGVERVILFFGERLALVLLSLFVMFLFFSGSIPQVLSKQEDPSSELSVSHEEQFPNRPAPTATPTPTLIPTATPTPEPTATPTPTSIPVPTANPSENEVWEKLALCETDGNWGIDTGNGYFGGLQFSQGAWESVGGSGNPASASKDEQIMRGKMLQERRGWGPWGSCSKSLNLN